MSKDKISHQYLASPCLPRYQLPRPVLGLRIDVACGGDGGLLAYGKQIVRKLRVTMFYCGGDGTLVFQYY